MVNCRPQSTRPSSRRTALGDGLTCSVSIAKRPDPDDGDDLALARIARERDRAALRFAKDRDLGGLEATMARLDAEAQAAVVRPSRTPTAAEARAYLEELPMLWAKTSDAGRHAIAEAVFERIDALGVTDYTVTLTAHAKARGWDAAFGAGVVRVKEGWSGRGERIFDRRSHAANRATSRDRSGAPASRVTGWARSSDRTHCDHSVASAGVSMTIAELPAALVQPTLSRNHMASPTARRPGRIGRRVLQGSEGGGGRETPRPDGRASLDRGTGRAGESRRPPLRLVGGDAQLRTT